jgi:hypothetical protein
MTEAQLMRAILARFGSNSQFRLWRSQPLVARTREGRVVRALPKGHPDLSGILAGGRAVFLEVKTPTGKLSKEQLAFGAMALRFGAAYAVVRSLDDVAVALGVGG